MSFNWKEFGLTIVAVVVAILLVDFAKKNYSKDPKSITVSTAPAK